MKPSRDDITCATNRLERTVEYISFTAFIPGTPEIIWVRRKTLWINPQASGQIIKLVTDILL